METLEAIALVLSAAAAWPAVTLFMLTRIHVPGAAGRRRRPAAQRDPAQPPAPRSLRALAAASRRPGSTSANYAPAWRRRTLGRSAIGAEDREGSMAS